MTAEQRAPAPASVPSGPARARGDRRALWAMVTSHAVQHIYVGGLALTYPLAVAAFHVSYAELGVVLTAAGLLGGLLQGAAGLLGRLSARTVLAAQNLGLAAAAALGAVAPGFATFGWARLMGAGVSWPQHPVGSAYLSDRFPDRRGTALSWHSVGGSVGTVAVPLVMSAIIEFSGWRWALAALAVMIAAGGLLVWLGLPREPRRAPPTPAAGASGTGGAPVDGLTGGAPLDGAGPAPGVDGAGVDGAAPAPGAGAGGAGADGAGAVAGVGGAAPVTLWSLLTRKRVVLVLAAATVAAGGRGLGTITTYLPAYLKSDLRLGQLQVGVIFTAVMAASVAGPVLAGHLADRFGRLRLLTGAYLAGAVAIAAFPLAGRGLAGLLLTGIAVGVFAYAESPLLQAVFADAVGAGRNRAAFGAFFAIAYGVGAIWLAVLGWVIDSFGFTAAFMIMAASFVAAAGLVLATRPNNPR